MGAGGSHSSARGAEMADRPPPPTRLVKGHIADVLTHGAGNRGAKAGDPHAGLDPAAQAYADQAYPFAGIGIAQTRAASSAAGKVHGHAPKHGGAWEELGPFTNDVATLATQTSTFYAVVVAAHPACRRSWLRRQGRQALHALRRRCGRRNLADGRRARPESALVPGQRRHPVDLIGALCRFDRPAGPHDLRRHRRGERLERLRGRPRPLPDRRRRPLVTRARELASRLDRSIGAIAVDPALPGAHLHRHRRRPSRCLVREWWPLSRRRARHKFGALRDDRRRVDLPAARLQPAVRPGGS